jgi:hypothetical protein
MGSLEKAIERIKILECPTGDVENRVAGILEDYKVADRNAIKVNKKEILDNGMEVYNAVISGDKEYRITVLAESGLDDYVATVVDAFVN